MKLHYFAVHGRIGGINYLVADRQVELEYSWVSEWPQAKETLKLPFGQLPLLEDGEVRIAQTQAIQRYLAKKAGAFGSDPKEEAEVDMWCERVLELLNEFVRRIFFEDQQKKKEFILGIEDKLKAVDDKLAGGGPFLVSGPSEPSMADYVLLYLAEFTEFYKPLQLANVNDFCVRMRERPNIAKYLQSDIGKQSLLPPRYEHLMKVDLS